MGDMADFDLDEVSCFEDLRDSFANGNLSYEESFDNGFLESNGAVSGFSGFSQDRVSVESYESCLSAIDRLESMLNPPFREEYLIVGDPENDTPRLNEKAVESLNKESPTCNVCHKEMKMRTGKFGDFFFLSKSVYRSKDG